MDEYTKACLAVYYAKIQEAAGRQSEKPEEFGVSASDQLFGTAETSSQRQVGMKSKQSDEDNDDVEWEEAESTVDTGNAGTSYILADLNVEAKESEEEEDDDIDWEEG